MLLALETFRVDLVDVLGAGGSRGKPSVFRRHLDPAERLTIAGSGGQRCPNRLAGKFFHDEPLGRKRLQHVLLRDGRGRVDPLVERRAQFIGEITEQLTGVLAGLRRDLGGQQAENDAVLVGGPDRSVAP